jgi:hypothetical protein
MSAQPPGECPLSHPFRRAQAGKLSPRKPPGIIAV